MAPQSIDPHGCPDGALERVYVGVALQGALFLVAVLAIAIALHKRREDLV
jgi:hypothetical protein